jgi:hypothetical protein
VSEACRERSEGWSKIQEAELRNRTAFASIIRSMQPALKPASRRALLVVCAVVAFALVLAAKDFVRPAAHPAQTYPAHDDHTDEKVAIGADPYDTADKAKIFSVNFHEHGFLPVFFVITNNGDQPISIANIDVKLITANHSKLTPASPDDIYRRITNPRANTRPPEPIPIPHKKVKGTITEKERAEIESSQFAAKAVEPHNTQSGFLFFDVEDISAPLAGAHIDVTGVNDGKGKELFYFDLSLDNYLNPPQKTN